MISLKDNLNTFDEGIEKWARSIIHEIIEHDLNYRQLAKCIATMSKQESGDCKNRYIKIFLHLGYRFKEIEKGVFSNLLLSLFFPEFDHEELDMKYILYTFYDSNKDLNTNKGLLNFLHDYLFEFKVKNLDLKSIFKEEDRSLEKIFITNFQINFLSTVENFKKIFQDKWRIYHLANYIDKDLKGLEPINQSEIAQLTLIKAFSDPNYMKILFEKSLTKKGVGNELRYSFLKGNSPDTTALPLLFLANQIYFDGGSQIWENQRRGIYRSSWSGFLPFLENLVEVLENEEYLKQIVSNFKNDSDNRNMILDEVREFIKAYLNNINNQNKDFFIDFKFKYLEPQNFG